MQYVGALLVEYLHASDRNNSGQSPLQRATWERRGTRSCSLLHFHSLLSFLSLTSNCKMAPSTSPFTASASLAHPTFASYRLASTSAASEQPEQRAHLLDAAAPERPASDDVGQLGYKEARARLLADNRLVPGELLEDDGTQGALYVAQQGELHLITLNEVSDALKSQPLVRQC